MVISTIEKDPVNIQNWAGLDNPKISFLEPGNVPLGDREKEERRVKGMKA